MSSRQAAFERLVRLTRRLERLCGEFMTTYVDLGEASNKEELNDGLQTLEMANSKLVNWVRKAQGLKHDSKVLTHEDTMNILKGKDATTENL